MHFATTSNNAFAKWETLGPPPTITTGTSPAWVALSPPSSPKVTAAPAAAAVATAASVQLPRQPPPTPNGIADNRPHNSSSSSRSSIVGEYFASADDGGRGRSRVPSASAAPPQDDRRGSSHRAPSSGTSEADHPSRSSATLPAAAPGSSTPAPASLLPPPQPEVPASSPARIPPPLFAARVPPPADISSVVVADAESLLARLARKAKQAAAAALSASAASTSSPSSGANRTGPRAAALRAGTETPAPIAIASNPDAAGGRGDYAGSAAGPSESGDGDRDGRRGRGLTAAAAAAAAAAPPAAVAVEAGGCARLAELCKEDKAKVARLMQDLVNLRAEKGGQRARFERLRAQNEVIVKEMAALKVKFGQSMQLLRKYQSIVQDGEPAAGRGAGARGSLGARSPESLAAAAAAADTKSLREALRAAEEASRKAEMEAAAEHAGRVAMAAELRRAKGQADDLRRQLDHHLHLRPEKPNPVAAGAKACRSLDSLNTAPAWARDEAPAGGPAPGKTTPLSAAGGDEPSAAAHGNIFPSTSTGGKGDALRASSRGSQAMPADDVSGLRATSGNERASARSPQQPLEQHQPNGATPAATANGGGGGGGSVVSTGGRRPQGWEGGVASNADLAAVKEQVETLKQQLVMVGVQQLALTVVPTAALRNRHEGAFPFHGPAPRAADRSVADDDATTANMGAEVPPFPEQRGGDRASTMPAHQQQQQQQQQQQRRRRRVLGRTTQPRRARRRGKDGPPEEQARGCEGSESSDGAGTPPTGKFAGEDKLFKGRPPAGGVASADDDEGVGWWARSAGNLLALADAIQHEQREAPNGEGNHGLATTGSRNGVARKAPTGAAADGRSCDQVSSSDPTEKAPLAAELPPAPARKSVEVGVGRPRPARGKSHRGVDAESGTVGVSTGGAPPVAAVSGGCRLRVSWSSVSARSSESDLERESAPASSVTSASNCGSGGSNSSRAGGCRRQRRRWHGDDAHGTVLLPRSRPPQRQRRHQEQQRQQVGSLYDRVSPSSCSSSSVSSRAFDRPNGGTAWTGRGVVGAGAGASRCAAAVGLRHQRDVGTEAASGGARRIPKAGVAAAVPGGSSSSGGRGGLLPPSSPALRRGGAANGRGTVAVAPGTRRAAAHVMLHHSNGEEGRWRGPSETGRDRGLQGMPPDDDDDDDDDTNEILALEGGRFFGGSLLDLIDDLEEESNEAAQIGNNSNSSSSSSSRLSSTTSTGSGGLRDGGGWRRRHGEKVFGLSSPVAALPQDNREEPGEKSDPPAFWRREGSGY